MQNQRKPRPKAEWNDWLAEEKEWCWLFEEKSITDTDEWNWSENPPSPPPPATPVDKVSNVNADWAVEIQTGEKANKLMDREY